MPAKMQMVDLVGQYQRIRPEIEQAMQEVLNTASYINGPVVDKFANALASYLDVRHVIPCANGTDALQIALMALHLKPGDEVIVPAFTYVATAEVIALLGLTPVMIDVDPNTYNIDIDAIEKAISPSTKAIVPVHLFGQTADIEAVLNIAEKHNLFIVEDAAQSIGSKYTFKDGKVKSSGTIGHIGTTSFFPSKNLGCFGDGGAIFTNDDDLAQKIKMISNHGQEKKYYHKVVGVNSRLDALQAAILLTKLRYLDEYSEARAKAAQAYDQAFADHPCLLIPARSDRSTHVFHQYTLKVTNGLRDQLKDYLWEQGIPSMIYYPLPLYMQDAFAQYHDSNNKLPVTEALCDSVLSLPIHTELTENDLKYITGHVASFFQMAMNSQKI